MVRGSTGEIQMTGMFGNNRKERGRIAALEAYIQDNEREILQILRAHYAALSVMRERCEALEGFVRECAATEHFGHTPLYVSKARALLSTPGTDEQAATIAELRGELDTCWKRRTECEQRLIAAEDRATAAEKEQP
jgi:hypothetical protein